MEKKITIINPFKPEAEYVLREDKSLELLAKNAPTPKKGLKISNPNITKTYVQTGNILKPVEKLEPDQKPYTFPKNFNVYM